MKNLKGKVILITGAASGLGKAMAQRFAQEGSIVVVADRNDAAGIEVAEAINGHFIQVDVADVKSVEQMIVQCVEKTGRLDVLVNNAGIESLWAPIHESTVENWQKVIDVDLTGVFYCMKYGIAQMLKQGGGGAVVNTCSTAGLVAFPVIPPYNAAKAGVANLTREAAIEYGTDLIRVNAVAPTAVKTDLLLRIVNDDPNQSIEDYETFNPLAGMPVPEDIAAAVAFLASDDARFISGVILPIDGGYTAR